MARRRTGLNRQHTRLQPHSGGQSHGVTVSLSDSGRSRTERVDIDSDLRVCSMHQLPPHSIPQSQGAIALVIVLIRCQISIGAKRPTHTAQVTRVHAIHYHVPRTKM